MTHDYKRHSTRTLLAALNVKSDLVSGDCLPRFRINEFLKFLRRMDRAVQGERGIHLILDHDTMHKTLEIRQKPEKHPRLKLLFTPTSASWLNLVERFLAEITARRIRRGSYSSGDDLEAAIYDYLLQHTGTPTPFVWSRTVKDIIGRERPL